MIFYSTMFLLLLLHPIRVVPERRLHIAHPKKQAEREHKPAYLVTAQAGPRAMTLYLYDILFPYKE